MCCDCTGHTGAHQRDGPSWGQREFRKGFLEKGLGWLEENEEDEVGKVSKAQKSEMVENIWEIAGMTVDCDL